MRFQKEGIGIWKNSEQHEELHLSPAVVISGAGLSRIN